MCRLKESEVDDPMWMHICTPLCEGMNKMHMALMWIHLLTPCGCMNETTNDPSVGAFVHEQGRFVLGVEGG